MILSQTLQATRQPRVVLEHMLRIGRHAIVSFPNFGHWRIRLQILFGGHMPRTDNLPYAWWDSPNIHFCTIKDFRELCEVVGAKMEKSVALNAWGSPIRLKVPWWFWNLFGEQAVFLLSRNGIEPARNAHRSITLDSQKKDPKTACAAWGPSGLRRRATGDIGGMGIARHAWTLRYEARRCGFNGAANCSACNSMEFFGGVHAYPLKRVANRDRRPA